MIECESNRGIVMEFGVEFPYLTISVAVFFRVGSLHFLGHLRFFQAELEQVVEFRREYESYRTFSTAICKDGKCHSCGLSVWTSNVLSLLPMYFPLDGREKQKIDSNFTVSCSRAFEGAARA